ncbi:hypothetical protein [Mangrovimonas sp. YM274]|uniref:hypothetical protein n=1 Tax=Mangrovimonas sp. YM274 TaxID=3070660 RepID=UPI0027DC78F8|nr:hypothetical protein [Mangrovimonas sp. YM274]WMI68219.1 hypothetical protein RBH95_13835 [Mangrovimonas sp. YM274]
MKPMNQFLSLLLLLVLTLSCKKDNEATEKEVNAVQQVLNFYSGECLRHKGFKSKNGETKTYFILEMSKSLLLESKANKLKPHAGNIAYLFYSHLDNEKSNYNEIRVKINLQNGTSSEFSYSDKEIEEIENLIPKINKVSDLIEKKDYQTLTNLFDKSIGVETSQIAEFFNNFEKEYGTIKQSQFQGFEFKETNNFGKVIKVNIAQVRENVALSMVLVLKRENHDLISIDFE